VDEASVATVPGLVKVVRKGNYLAVVCQREEQAIQAARQLKARGRSRPPAPFPASDDLFTYMRACHADLQRARRRWPAIRTRRSRRRRRWSKADYDVPYQGHTAIGPRTRWPIRRTGR
jgi:hypothetical protein